MLQSIRNWVQGWLALVIVGLISIPFALWGINYYFGQGGEVLALQINDTAVTLREYQQAYQNLRQRLQQIKGAEELLRQEDFLRQQTINGLIQRTLITQFNNEVGAFISDAQIKASLDSIPAFQGVDGFDPSLYQASLAQLGLSATAFEQQVRSDMSAEQLQSALLESLFVTNSELLQLAVIEHQQRDFSYAVLSSDPIKESTVVSEKDIAEYYETSGDLFMEPEKVAIHYIDLSLQRIADAISVNEEDLRSFYEANKQNYSVEEQRDIRQILVALPEGADEGKAAQARSVAELLAERAATGTDLKLVTETRPESVDVEYAELSAIARGILEPELEEIVFTAAAGEIRGPIRSKLGYHIVEVTGIKGGTTDALDDVRAEVVEDYRLAEAERQFFDLADELATLAYEHPDTLEIAAEELNLPIRASDWLDRDNAGRSNDLLANPAVINAAFSDEVLINGNNSEAIEVDSSRIVVLRVKEHVPKQRRPLAEVRDRIITRLKFERARQAVKRHGEEILDAIRRGDPAADIADTYQLQWQQADAVSHNDVSVNRAILRKAFQMSPPGESPVADGVSLGNGDYAILVLKAVHNADADTLPGETLDALRKRILQARTTSAWTEFIATLRQQADITVFEDRL